MLVTGMAPQGFTTALTQECTHHSFYMLSLLHATGLVAFHPLIPLHFRDLLKCP